MKAHLLPHPSRLGALVWKRTRSSWALLISTAGVNISLLAALATFLLAIGYEPFRAFALENWLLGTLAVLIVNVLMADLVRIRPEGVTASRIVFAWRLEAPVPLGGRFRLTPSSMPGEPDRPQDPDPDEFTTCIYYERDDVLVAIDCHRPGPTVDWLNAQLHRIQALQLPRAHVVERTPAGNDPGDRNIE